MMYDSSGRCFAEHTRAVSTNRVARRFGGSLRTVVALSIVLSHSACRANEPPPSSEVPASDSELETRLELEVAPFADFYFEIRAQAAGVVEPTDQLRSSIEAWMPVQNEIGSFGGFWRFDLAGLESSSPSEFADWFADFPDQIPSRSGGTIPIKSAGLGMAEEMRSAWPHFLDQEWPDRFRRLDEVVSRLEREFMPKHREALVYMLESLGIADPKIAVPTYLVLETHPPGASTYRSSTGPVAVLSVRDLLDEGRFSDLEETLLHETCHALDLVSQKESNAFSSLKQLLLDRGVGERDPRLREIPHLLMFAQAENTMRRLYDRDHLAYGDTQRGEIAPLYQRSGEAAVVVRSVWSKYLDGAFGRQEALQQIVDQLIP